MNFPGAHAFSFPKGYKSKYGITIPTKSIDLKNDIPIGCIRKALEQTPLDAATPEIIEYALMCKEKSPDADAQFAEGLSGDLVKPTLHRKFDLSAYDTDWLCHNLAHFNHRLAKGIVLAQASVLGTKKGQRKCRETAKIIASVVVR